jgi:hypothetical protein
MTLLQVAKRPFLACLWSSHDSAIMCRRVEGAYALQLALSAMHALLAEQPEDGCSHHVSFEAVMDCLRHCDDRLVQNAALSLLGLLAAAMPQQQLARLIEVNCTLALTSMPLDQVNAWTATYLAAGSAISAVPAGCCHAPAAAWPPHQGDCAH